MIQNSVIPSIIEKMQFG